MVRRLVHILLVSVPFLLTTSAAVAHDSWISRGGFKNAAGEWCCGEGDCFALSPQIVRPGIRGYVVSGREVHPYTQVLPSPDGQFWRCHKPDGSPRCFFAPPSSM